MGLSRTDLPGLYGAIQMPLIDQILGRVNKMTWDEGHLVLTTFPCESSSTLSYFPGMFQENVAVLVRLQ